MNKRVLLVNLLLLLILLSCSTYLKKEVVILLLFSCGGVLSYSVPFFKSGSAKKRFRELLFFKDPILALVWSISTVLIPLLQNGETICSLPVLLQTCSRFLFIFSLCIPFELRDEEFDRSMNIKTLPVVYGSMVVKWIGLFIVGAEIIIHHSGISPLPDSMWKILALDSSSVLAFVWIYTTTAYRSPYFYKLGVDGTMLIRFFFLLITLSI